MKPGEFKASCKIKRPVQLVDVPTDVMPLVDADIRTPGRIVSRWDRDLHVNVVDLPCAFETADKAEFEAHMLEVHDRKMGSYQGVRGSWTGRYPRQLKMGAGMWRPRKGVKPFDPKKHDVAACRGCGLVVELGTGSTEFIEAHKAACPERVDVAS